jgi:sugar transferase EpsL
MGGQKGIYPTCGKRLLDLAITVPFILALSPLLALVALAILVSMGQPILFRQVRAGLHHEPFTLVKFRTLSKVNGEAGTSGSDRVTRLGQLLRSTSMDELPELFSVLLGKMSLVGPRPLLMEYLPLYTRDQARRHEVRPGITGWAQINGRNRISWERKFELDIWYVDHISFVLDVRILLGTIGKVMKRESVNQTRDLTCEPFRGSHDRRI